MAFARSLSTSFSMLTLVESSQELGSKMRKLISISSDKIHPRDNPLHGLLQSPIVRCTDRLIRDSLKRHSISYLFGVGFDARFLPPQLCSFYDLGNYDLKMRNPTIGLEIDR